MSEASGQREPAGRLDHTVPRLDARGITKSYGKLTVLRDVSLRVAAGEVVALVGENGAGKSSLVSCLSRIIELDAGEVLLDGRPLPGTPDQVRQAGVEVLWQDHGLCDDLDVVANVFLGRESGRWLVAESHMRKQTVATLRQMGAEKLPLDRPVRGLSRGQRQLVAMARVLLGEPRVLLLDEPTAALGVAETLQVQRVIRRARGSGAAVLLVTHDLDQVFTLADRVVVLRDGRIVADVSPLEVRRDDIVALMSGIETDSMARRQLERLRSLVDQLSDVDPAASLPLIVSAMAAALDQQMLCVHLLETPSIEGGGPTPALRRAAAVGMPARLLDVNERLPLGAAGGTAGLAGETAEPVVIEDVAVDSLLDHAPDHRRAAGDTGIRSEWAVPIVGAHGVLGTVTGFATSVGRPEPAQLELARLYLVYVAAAIERGRLLAEVSRRNRVLESLRTMLETLAGPDRVVSGVGGSLVALGRALGASAVGVVVDQGEGPQLAVVHRGHEAGDRAQGERAADHTSEQAFRDAARAVLADATRGDARFVEPDLAAVALRHPEGPAALVARVPGAISATAGDTLELLDDATRSLALALEGEALEHTRREAAALRRSQAIQRELLSSLSHELRTPLTAIQGYASTLLQPDLTWDEASTTRFLRSIASEGERMARLVSDLLDSSAIESGVLRLQRHWCDLRLVVEAAARVLGGRAAIRVHSGDGLEPIWADHDRLEQVFVNVLENAATHGASPAGIDVTVRSGAAPGTAEVEVSDHGPGISPALAGRIFDARVSGSASGGAGLGLSIAKAIVEAHGGTVVAAGSERGATFVVTLPCDPPDGAPDRPAAADPGLDVTWTLVGPAVEPAVDAALNPATETPRGARV